MFTRLMVLCWVVVVLCSGGCGQAENQGSGQSGNEYNDGTTIIPATTKVITQEGIILSLSWDGSLLLDKNSDVAKNLEAGDVLVVGVTSKTPNGLLVKVDGIGEQDNGLAVYTSQASLEQAIQQADMDLSFSLTPEMATASMPLTSGVSVIEAPLEIDTGVKSKFQVKLNDVVLYDADNNADTTDDQIVAKGKVDISLGINFNAKIKSFKLQELSFGPQIIESGNLDVVVKSSLIKGEKKYKKELASFSFAPVVFMVGPVPVVITPKMTVYVGLDGKINAAIKTGIQQDLKIDAGIKYKDGMWADYGEVNVKFGYTPPSVDVMANIKAYVGPELKLTVNAIVGPNLSVNAYLDFSADVKIKENPWWTLYAGIEGKAGIKLEVLSHVIAYFETDDFIGYKILVAQADMCGDGECTDNEDCEICEVDCGSCLITCGNGACEYNYGENCKKCIQDCGCDSEETCSNDGTCCKPNCYSYEYSSNKECGNDGCGGSCGACGPGLICKKDYYCTLDDICGDGICDASEKCFTCTYDCGCSNSKVCMGDGTCCQVSCYNKECGSDDCGGSCGSCDAGDKCENGKCVSDDVYCGNNKCENGETCSNCKDDCGTCPVGCGNGNCDSDEDCYSCSSDCKCNNSEVCVMLIGIPPEVFCCTPDCYMKECGSDGCNESCGSCGVGYKCVDGECADSCTPNCSGKECGSDGCGGSCGNCGWYICKNGKCDFSCGDGSCTSEEDCESCPDDCGECEVTCGDGECDKAGGEDCETCEDDCGKCSAVCGFGKCESDEVCAGAYICCKKGCVNVELDNYCAPCGQGEFGENCGECPANLICIKDYKNIGQCGSCGNGKCDGAENCNTCSKDCGNC